MGVSGTFAKTCNYNRSTNELACTVNYSDNRPLVYTSVVTFRFAAAGDFVGDAPRLVHFSSAEFRPTSNVIAVTTPGLQSTLTSTYAYDAQRRLTGLTSQSSAGASSVLTLTAWDTFGRPTAGRDATSNYAYAFNDAARTVTITNLTASAVITQTFDGNGIQIAQTSVSPTATETQTTTISSTAMVCR